VYYIELIKDFFAEKPLQFRGNSNAVKKATEENEDAGPALVEGQGRLTKNQEKKLAKEKAIAERKAAIAAEKAEKAAAALVTTSNTSID